MKNENYEASVSFVTPPPNLRNHSERVHRHKYSVVEAVSTQTCMKYSALTCLIRIYNNSRKSYIPIWIKHSFRTLVGLHIYLLLTQPNGIYCNAHRLKRDWVREMRNVYKFLVVNTKEIRPDRPRHKLEDNRKTHSSEKCEGMDLI